MSGLPLYGLDKELAAKEQAKRDPALEKAVENFLQEISGVKFTEDLMTELKSGVVLCKAMNAVVPGTIKINESKMPFKQMENIANFLKACRQQLSMAEHDLFTTADLYDGKSVYNVVNGCVAFSRAAGRSGYKGTIVGAAERKNPREKRPSKWDDSIGKSSEPNKWNQGSAGIMERSAIDKTRDITFGHDVTK